MHSVPITRSPSSFSLTRNTPCVAGCCGPILMTSSSASRYVISGIMIQWQVISGKWQVLKQLVNGAWQVEKWFSFCHFPPTTCHFSFLLSTLDVQICLHPGLILAQDVVVFAQRMSHPLVRQQNAP